LPPPVRAPLKADTLTPSRTILSCTDGKARQSKRALPRRPLRVSQRVDTGARQHRHTTQAATRTQRCRRVDTGARQLSAAECVHLRQAGVPLVSVDRGTTQSSRVSSSPGNLAPSFFPYPAHTHTHTHTHPHTHTHTHTANEGRRRLSSCGFRGAPACSWNYRGARPWCTRHVTLVTGLRLDAQDSERECYSNAAQGDGVTYHRRVTVF